MAQTLWEAEKSFEAMKAPYFKSHYRGMPTKRIQKIWAKQEKARSVKPGEVIQLLGLKK